MSSVLMYTYLGMYNDFVCAKCNTALQIFASINTNGFCFAIFILEYQKHLMLSNVHLLYFWQKTMQTLDKRIIGLITSPVLL